MTAATLGVVLVALALWPKPRGYTYQSKTVEEWFDEAADSIHRFRSSDPLDATLAASLARFQAMGTNALPFLVERLRSTSWTDRIIKKLPQQLRTKEPTKKQIKIGAAVVLIGHMQLPPEVVAPYLGPLEYNALQLVSSNFLYWEKNPPTSPLP